MLATVIKFSVEKQQNSSIHSFRELNVSNLSGWVVYAHLVPVGEMYMYNSLFMFTLLPEVGGGGCGL